LYTNSQCSQGYLEFYTHSKCSQGYLLFCIRSRCSQGYLKYCIHSKCDILCNVLINQTFDVLHTFPLNCWYLFDHGQSADRSHSTCDQCSPSSGACSDIACYSPLQTSREILPSGNRKPLSAKQIIQTITQKVRGDTK